MKTRYLHFAAMITIAVVLPTSFTSCSDDSHDDEDGSGKQTETSVNVTMTSDGQFTDGLLIYSISSNTNKEMGVVGVVETSKKIVTEIEIPSTIFDGTTTYKVTNIGERAFQYISSLNTITIPNSVTSIGEYAFLMCDGLKQVNITDLSAWCNITFEDTPLYCAYSLYLNGTKITELIIPDGVTEIKGDAFVNCIELTSVVIPNSVTSIGGGAFCGCSRLTDVFVKSTNPYSIFSDSDQYIYTSAFDSYQKTLHVPKGSKESYTNSFWNYYWSIVDDVEEY